MKPAYNIVILITFVVLAVVLLYAQINTTQTTSNSIFPGKISSTELACLLNSYGQHSNLLNTSGISIFNVSGYEDYVIAPGTGGLISFNVSYSKTSGFNNSKINVTNNFDFYHSENATLVNYSTGSSLVNCSIYNNRTTICSGSLPTACYLDNSGDIICQPQYAACIGTVYVIPANSSNQGAGGLMGDYNYTCDSKYSPPVSVTLDLTTTPGISISISPKNETILYNDEINGVINISASANALKGTYLAVFNPTFCGRDTYVLITIGNSPYSGTIPEQASPLTIG
jgi:hypothetical protein